MPTYDYFCESCDHQFEASQKITEAPLSQCPECCKETLRRGIGGGSATFRFMGSGFYITDYKKSCSSEGNGCCPCKE